MIPDDKQRGTPLDDLTKQHLDDGAMISRSGPVDVKFLVNVMARCSAEYNSKIRLRRLNLTSGDISGRVSDLAGLS